MHSSTRRHSVQPAELAVQRAGPNRRSGRPHREAALL